MRLPIPLPAALLPLCLIACAAPAPPPSPNPATPDPADGFIQGFRSQHALDLAIELQALSEHDRLARLRTIADSGPRPSDTFILCRLLFEPRPGDPFPRPLLGAPHFIGGAISPLEPIELRDGVPILVVLGYSLAGLPDTPAGDLERCLQNARWRTTPLTPRTPAQARAAIEAFIREHRLDDHERAFLRAQAE